jgi:hypothetical protein
MRLKAFRRYLIPLWFIAFLSGYIFEFIDSEGQDFQSEVFFIAVSVAVVLDVQDLVVEARDESQAAAITLPE